ncbi:alpha/beta hydrolase family protein [Bradyrhizobium sp.]|jgi:acyl transferase
MIMMPPLQHREEVLLTRERRRLVVWETSQGTRHSAPVLVLASGFCRRMHAQAGLALYLAANGFRVIRYDPVDHIGLSDGDVIDFTMSAGLQSMERVLEHARSLTGRQSLGLIASSLSGRMAMAACGGRHRPDFLLLLAPVVALQQTMVEVFGADHAVTPRGELPERVEFEGHEIDALRFYDDAHQNGWFEVDPVASALRGGDMPITVFSSADDAWVSFADLKRLCPEREIPSRRIVEIRGVGHDLSRNQGTARQLLLQLVSWSRRFAQSADTPIVEPSFSELIGASLRERRLQRDRDGAFTILAEANLANGR